MHRVIAILIEEPDASIAQHLIESYLDVMEENKFDYYTIRPPARFSWLELPNCEKEITPLKDCLNAVKKLEEHYRLKALKIILRGFWRWILTTRPSIPMFGHRLVKAGELLGEVFSMEYSIWNYRNFDYSIPENVEGFWVVFADFHY